MSSERNIPSDPTILIHVGKLFIGQVVQTCSYTILYGAFCLLYLQSTATYLKKKQSNKAQFWMFLLSTATFLLATVHEATLLAYVGIAIHSILVGSQNIPLIERLPYANNLLQKPNSVLAWAGYLEFIISDAVVSWRAFILLQGRVWVMIIPGLLLLGSAAYIVIITRGNYFSAGGALETHNLDIIGLGLSLATNIVATALIGYVYWSHRKDMVAGLGKHKTTRAERVLALLLESGSIFCLFQAIVFILGFTPAFDDDSTIAFYAQTIFPTTFFAFSAMYPTMVIVLVNAHRTLDYEYSTNMSLPRISEVEPGRVTTLQFAHADRTSSHNSEKRGDSNAA
ncbi:hypothetical protein BDZ94DRAFT_1303186 [Collybia nuda]|uniref:Uncharacterized protein n=1 Tax=Collybia nuda TaxID=64659 RepID=A0A9P5YIY5_9AGAR|nr:hypothetical protein BDZ94DRAFT_1303186 [Collybia nuda]